MPQLSLIPSGEAGEVAEDVRQLFEELSPTLSPRERTYSGECHPALDVFETDAALQVTLEAAGVRLDALRVLFRGGVLVIVGMKAPPPPGGTEGSDQTFHLVEREFGRFARAVRVNGAFDVGRAEARLADGELTIILPKILERRGSAHRIDIASGPPPRS